jgi:hypothetical protein
VRSVATRFASAQEILPIGFHPSDNNFVHRLHVESVLGGYAAENCISSPTRSCSRQAFLQIQRWERTEKGVSALTFTSMITSNQNEHDRSDICGTRRDNVEAHPVDVEIESRHNSNLGVPCHQRTTARHMGTKTPALLLLPRVMCDQRKPPGPSKAKKIVGTQEPKRRP